MTISDNKTLTHLLDALEKAAKGETTSVRDIISAIGDRSIMPLVLVISVLVASPLSGIPGLPTLAALILLILIGQALSRRRRLWLPDFLMRREVASSRLRTAVRWLRGICAWFDRHARPRLRILTSGVLRPLTLIVCMVVALAFPFLEFVPFSSSFAAVAIAMISFGVLTRDGIWVLAGYAQLAIVVAFIIWLVPG